MNDFCSVHLSLDSKAAKKSNTDDKAEKTDKSPGASAVKAVEDDKKSEEKEGSPAVEGKTSDKPHAKQTEAQKGNMDLDLAYQYEVAHLMRNEPLPVAFDAKQTAL